MYYICQLKAEEDLNLANHAKEREEVLLPHLKLHYFLFYYTKHKKESRKELHVKREEELAERENLVESKYRINVLNIIIYMIYICRMNFKIISNLGFL